MRGGVRRMERNMLSISHALWPHAAWKSSAGWREGSMEWTQRGSAFGRQDVCCVRIRSGCVLSEGNISPVRGYFRTGRGDPLGTASRDGSACSEFPRAQSDHQRPVRCDPCYGGGKKSGSLITVDLALEQGRDIYALPGPVNSALSDGCNRLIRQGAGILLSPEALLEEWGIEKSGTSEGSKKEIKNEKMLESAEKLVYSCLGLYPKDLDQLVRETKLDIKALLEKLVSLELQGYVREISKNHYIISE